MKILLYIPKIDVVLVTQLISASNASLLSFYVILLQFSRTMRTGLHTFLKMMDNSKHFVCEVEVFNDNWVFFVVLMAVAVIQKTVKLCFHLCKF